MLGTLDQIHVFDISSSNPCINCGFNCRLQLKAYALLCFALI